MSSSGTSLSQVVGMFQGIKNIASAGSTAEQIMNTLLGDSGVQQISDALTNIAQEITTGFADVVAQIQTTEYQTDWNYFSSQISQIQQTHASYASELAELQFSNGEYSVVSDGLVVSFQSWCEGTDGTDGALGVLWTQVDNLQSIFKTGGESGSGLIGTWTAFCNSASATQLSGFTGQTIFTMTFQMMQEIFATLTALYYTRESSLALYYQTVTSSSYTFETMADYVTQNFGNTTTSNTVWAQFAEALESFYQSDDTPPESCISVSTSCDSTPDDGTYFSWDSNTIWLPVGQFSLQDNTFTWGPMTVPLPANCIVGNLQFKTVSTSIEVTTTETGYPTMNPFSVSGTLMYLSITPIEIGPNLSFTPATEIPAIPDLYDSGFGISSVYQLNSGGYQAATGDTAAVYSYIDGNFPPLPPVQEDPNMVNVVTGVSFQPCGNRIGLALQYGVLDLSDPTNPALSVTDTSFYGADGEGPCWFPVMGWDNCSTNIAYTDLRAAGTSDNFPINSAALAQTFPTGTGNRVGLVLQSNLPIYAADFFQPANLGTVFTPAATAAS